MKTGIKLFLLTAIAAVCFGCENNADKPPVGGVPGLENVTGVVTNESGEALEGIRIEVYYDEALQEHYPSNDWYLLSDEDKKQFPECEPVVYTDAMGNYTVSEVARYGVSALDVYVVATDTAAKYQQQVQKGQIMYTTVKGVHENEKLVAGRGVVDFVLVEK